MAVHQKRLPQERVARARDYKAEIVTFNIELEVPACCTRHKIHLIKDSWLIRGAQCEQEPHVLGTTDQVLHVRVRLAEGSIQEVRISEL